MRLIKNWMMFSEGDAGGASGGGDGSGGQSGGAEPSALGGDPKPSSLGGFLDAVSDETLRSDKTLAPLRGKDATEAAKMLVNQSKLLGKSRLEKPEENWTDEQYGNFYKSLGRPDKPEDYGFKKPEQMPEGVEYDEATAKWFAEAAHKAGLTPRQAQVLMSSEIEHVAGIRKSQIEQQQASEAISRADFDKLKKDWGRDFDVKVEDARRAVRAYGGEDLSRFLEESGLGDHPKLIRAFAAAGASLREDRAVSGNGGGSVENATIEEQISALRQSEAYNDPQHLDHKRVQEKVTQLYRIKRS